MKFQNCILINFEQTHGRQGGRTDKPKAICPSNFSKAGGMKMGAGRGFERSPCTHSGSATVYNE